MKRIFQRSIVVAAFVAALPGATLAQGLSAHHAQRSLFEMRLASPAPLADHDRMESVVGGKVAWVGRVNVIADDMVEHLGAKPTKTGLLLELVLSGEGRRRLTEATSEQGVEWIAVLLDSKLVIAVPIVSPAGSTPITVIGASLSQEDAARMQAKIAARWPGQSP